MTEYDAQAHYGDGAPKFRRDVQPIELILSMGMGFMAGNVIKYVSRYKRKGGVDDLRKARIYLEWLIADEDNLAREAEADRNDL